jgi:S-adenosylmethionine:diacylglycerol 3-amino-3-carboxypropyl transferase
MSRKFLFDFGLSQEDPFTEQLTLEVKPGDRILSLASGGEVPLTLSALNENIQVTAVDISENQIRLCRLKLCAALHIKFPLNGRFLGYGKLSGGNREALYHAEIRPFLSAEDAEYWDGKISYIRKGITGAGRFERYLRKLKGLGGLVIGKKNLYQLILAATPEDQARVFDTRIATRKVLQLLFKIAFHPAVYRKRGLQDQALIHAGKSTGERFYGKFRDFCTSTPASANYFMHYFLIGGCVTDDAYPAYLHPEPLERLKANLEHLEFRVQSFQDALQEMEPGYYNKVHLSNLGDWLSEAEFESMTGIFRERLLPGTRICYRHLQKNHLKEGTGWYEIERDLSEQSQRLDRFLFYTVQLMVITRQ